MGLRDRLQDARKKTADLAQDTRQKSAELAEDAKRRGGDLTDNARQRTADLASAHSAQMHEAVEKVAAAADQRTGGKYTEKIEKAGTRANDLTARLAANAKDSDTPGGSDR